MAGRARVAFRFSIASITDVITTFHANFPGVPTPTSSDVVELIGAAEDWWSTDSGAIQSLAESYSNEVKLEDVTGQAFTPNPENPVIITSGVTGTDATNDPAPPQVAVGMRLRSAVATRRGRGRMYLPPPPSIRIGSTGTLLSGAWRDQFVISAVSLTDRVNATAAGWEMAVYSRVDGVARPVISTTIGTRVDTQRRRLPRGENYL